MPIVVVGHVDHGKSTVVGRILADSGAQPDGKLAQVRELCARTSKPFEYAFLLDALKDERDRASPSTPRASSSRAPAAPT